MIKGKFRLMAQTWTTSETISEPFEVASFKRKGYAEKAMDNLKDIYSKMWVEEKEVKNW